MRFSLGSQRLPLQFFCLFDSDEIFPREPEAPTTVFLRHGMLLLNISQKSFQSQANACATIVVGDVY
jgi:hypothetical protein